jgi:hypothetical protein
MMLAKFAGRSYELYPWDWQKSQVPILFLHGDLSHPMFPPWPIFKERQWPSFQRASTGGL